MAQKDWVGNETNHQQEEEEEEEEDEDVMNEDRVNHSNELSLDHSGNHRAATSATVEQLEEAPSTEEMQDRMDQFTYIMQKKFLCREDHEHLDYSRINDDEALDDHWIKEANLDAEDKYFAED